MAAGSDRACGAALVTLSVAIFAYYTLWVIFLPFIDIGHPLHSYFLPQEYAISIPLLLIAFVLCAVVTFLGCVMINSRK